jgi:hypothetical protein
MSPVDSGPAETAAAVKCDLASEVLQSFGKLRFAATGWSMLPTVWPRDTLVVERINPDQAKVGEVVLVGRDRRLCAHRVVSRVEGSGNPHWITQGDAMSVPDRPVSENELLGRVTSVIRAGRFIALPAEMNVAAKLIAKIVRRSVPAARALVYLHGIIQNPGNSSPGKAVHPCQG